MLSVLTDNVYFLDICKKLQREFGLKVSEATVKRARKKLGWIKSGPKYCQLVKEKNRIARLNFCLEASRTKDNFVNVIFTDECLVWMDTHAKICFRRIGELPKHKPKVKHPYKIHVWAGISTRGASDILLFTGIMRKEFYVDKILRGQLLPFIKECFPNGNYRFQQDNDPKHKSKLA